MGPRCDADVGAIMRTVAVVGLILAACTQPAAAKKIEKETDEKVPSKPPLKLGVAIRAARPWSFTATVGPVALGAALAFKDLQKDEFDLALLAFTLVTTVAVHAAGNLMNTLVDFKKGLDTESSSDLTLVSGDLQPKQVAMLIRRSYGIAALAAIPLCEKSDAPLLSLLGMLVAGAGSAYVYTGGPGLKYRALGDVLISTTFGPLLVAFAYVTQVHAFCVFSLYPRIRSDRACVCSYRWARSAGARCLAPYRSHCT